MEALLEGKSIVESQKIIESRSRTNVESRSIVLWEHELEQCFKQSKALLRAGALLEWELAFLLGPGALLGMGTLLGVVAFWGVGAGGALLLEAAEVLL